MGAPRDVSIVALVALVFALVFGGTAAAVQAAPCPDNPDALGVSRVLTLRAADYFRLGRMQYRTSLPLAEREVVLTFDDGPLPPYTDRVLKILAHECVKATFFLVGRHAAAHPATARKIYAAGHTIGTHSQNHPFRFDSFGVKRIEREVDNGIASVSAALGPNNAPAPFFRIPGLRRSGTVERYLEKHDLVLWSADAVADDWTPISSKTVLARALSRLKARGNRGILLLHDIQPRTVLMLPELLTELKKRHYRIVHVVPEPAMPVYVAYHDSPDEKFPRATAVEKTVAAAPRFPVYYDAPKQVWPRVASIGETKVSPPKVQSILAALDNVTPAAGEIPLPRPKPAKKKRSHTPPPVKEYNFGSVLVGLFTVSQARETH